MNIMAIIPQIAFVAIVLFFFIIIANYIKQNYLKNNEVWNDLTKGFSKKKEQPKVIEVTEVKQIESNK